MRIDFLTVALAAALSLTQARDPDVEFRQMADLLKLSEGMIAADVGAGGGTWTVRLAERVGPKGRVYGTDVKSAQVSGVASNAKSKGLTNVTAVLGSQDDMGLPPGCCDAMLLRLVYHAFDNPVRMRESMQRAMKPKSRVLIIDFRPPPDELTAEMKSIGFERIEFVERWQGQEGVYAALFVLTPGEASAPDRPPTLVEPAPPPQRRLPQSARRLKRQSPSDR
jgi:ubiquinone/menaquinone biosynthesis C-methylase UbiE